MKKATSKAKIAQVTALFSTTVDNASLCTNPKIPRITTNETMKTEDHAVVSCTNSTNEALTMKKLAKIIDKNNETVLLSMIPDFIRSA